MFSSSFVSNPRICHPSKFPFLRSSKTRIRRERSRLVPLDRFREIRSSFVVRIAKIGRENNRDCCGDLTSLRPIDRVDLTRFDLFFGDIVHDGEESSLQGDAEGEDRVVLCSSGGGRRRNEWHAARLASLNTSHTVTWEEFKKKQKEDELRKSEQDADKDRMMREYRAQLDAERARKLSLGRNHSGKSHHKRERKEKESKKESSRKRKKKRSSSPSSSSSCSDSSSSDDERGSRRSRSKSRPKRTKKHRKNRSMHNHSSSDSEDEDGPVRLSKFFGNAKS